MDAFATELRRIAEHLNRKTVHIMNIIILDRNKSKVKCMTTRIRGWGKNC